MATSPSDALARIAATLGGKGRPSAKGEYACRCPIHSDRDPSLTVGIGRSGRIVLHCFAGCDPLLIIANLRARGLWTDEKVDAATIARLRADSEAYRLERFLEARRLWSETVPLQGTPGEDYLRRVRAITVDPGPRLHWHWRLFALVALITDPVTDQARGVQITPIDRLTHARKGGLNCVIRDKKRPETWLIERRRDPGDRRFIGETGVVRLLDGPGEIVVGEGIETSLSGAEIVGAKTALSALSASGLARLRLPLGIRDIGILVDRDAAGERAAFAAEKRLFAADRSRLIRRLWPRPPHNDFNDLARARRREAQP